MGSTCQRQLRAPLRYPTSAPKMGLYADRGDGCVSCTCESRTEAGYCVPLFFRAFVQVTLIENNYRSVHASASRARGFLLRY